jgi:hypothetical protein
MKHSNILMIFILLMDWRCFAGSQSNTTNLVAPATNSYIVTLWREADQDGCAKDFSVQRHHIFRHALNGFATNLDAATVKKLKHDPRVLAVERDGPIQLCGQTVPSGIIRMGPGPISRCGAATPST